jgi:hypothetical protein
VGRPALPHKFYKKEVTMVKTIPLNGYTKLISLGIVLLSLAVGWAVAATIMKKDIESNTANIVLLREDINEIKQDVKELLKR